ncbi:uncharacterized protein [Palaemon carinicauda]|uniref:uncharacterized protein n=1 Tax=Palaemon carinicauda TaxID=392227 RepID=UPI0035B65502
MKSIICIILTVYVVMGNSLGLKRIKRGERWDMECKDPAAMMAKMTSMMCDDEVCKENAPKCVSAMIPPGDLCNIMEKCKEELQWNSDSGKRPKMTPKMKKAMMECTIKKHMHSLELEYTPGNMKENSLALMTKSLSMTNEVNEKTKSAMLSAMSGTCAMPSGTSEGINHTNSRRCDWPKDG